MSSLSRRKFLRMVAAFAASGAAAWVSDVSDVEAAPVIGVDPAESKGDETVFFPGLDEIITSGHIDQFEQPFAPYFVERSSVFVDWDDMEDGNTWGGSE